MIVKFLLLLFPVFMLGVYCQWDTGAVYIDFNALSILNIINMQCYFLLGLWVYNITPALFNCKTFAGGDPDTQVEFKSDEVVNDKSYGEISDPGGNAPIIPTKLVDDENKTNSSNANQTVLISCILNKPDIKTSVEVVNASRLSQVLQLEHNVTHKGIPGNCVAVLFYSASCPFSCMAAPHFNALPRFFPDIKMVAVDAMQYRSFNTQYGIIGTPTLMLFHRGRPAVRFNETSEYGLEVFASFITKHTGIKPLGKLVVTSADFGGPVSSIPVKETDYYLILSWMVIAARILYSLYYSTWGRSFVDATLNAWREAEAQHHHVD